MNVVFNIAFLCATFLFCLSSSTTINTSSGTIIGTTQYYRGLIPVNAYLGIPFAEPPVDDLRFLKPVPKKPWTEPLLANKLPPGCPQFSKYPFPWLDNLPGLSPDCLFLNIWVPPTVKLLKKSVMFYIHVGGFGLGSSRLDFYNGQALAALGDVIVVTTNYRLGVEGFFNSHSNDAPGNMGMYDLIESLKWVRQNIKYFGGDENSITLFGTSAGGIAIGMFTVSPLTRGLFKRAILQSGTPANLDGEDKNFDFKMSRRIAEAVGCAGGEIKLEEDPEAVVRCMKGKDPFELVRKLRDVADVKMTSFRSFYPSYGSEFLPKNPRISIIEGDFEPVDLMIGTNDGDGSDILTDTLYTDVFGFFGEKDTQLNRTAGEKIIREQFVKFTDSEAVIQHYLGTVAEDDYDEVRFQVLTAVGDYSRTCHSTYLAESFAKKTRNVYYYFLTNIPSYTPWAPWMLSVHHDEAPFVFGYPLRYPGNYSIADRNLSRRMIQAWSSFAKTGRPTGFLWPRYSKDRPMFQTLNSRTDEVGYGPHRENCEFFRKNFGF